MALLAEDRAARADGLFSGRCAQDSPRHEFLCRVLAQPFDETDGGGGEKGGLIIEVCDRASVTRGGACVRRITYIASSALREM